jgi:alkane 1-monooxygenase
VRSLPYWVFFAIPIATVLGLHAGGPWTVAGLAFVFVLIPLLEQLLGLRTDNDDTDGPARRLAYDLPLFVWLPVQLAVQVYGLTLVLAGGLGVAEIIVTIFAIGLLTGGGGINIAHELMHRSRAYERAAAEVLMASASYTHFCIEHVHGHHRHVATPLDAASSRLGESLYAYLPRTFIGGFRSAWRIEAERARRLGIAWWSPRHRMTRYLATQAILYIGLLAISPLAVIFWAGQGLFAAVLLETINYVEHYGLQRREVSPGRYERVQPWHSWNSAHRLTNWLLFNLQRHSDHHFLASRTYPQLRHYDNVPQLPAGYATMILIALVPPLWRRMMDTRVAEWNAHSVEARAA